MGNGNGTENAFDLIVIGTGNAGTAMAHEARRNGWKVAIIDELPYGGTCAVKGCVPKKVLAGAAEVIARARAMQGKGVAGGIRIDWPELMRFKRTFTDPVEQNKTALYARAGIGQYHGHARFLGPDTIGVGEEILSARFIGIATGAVPVQLGIPGADLVRTSDDFLAMEALPERILFIGGGFVSFELAEIAAMAGAKATILNRSTRVLRGFDPFLVNILAEELRRGGMAIHTGIRIESVAEQAGGFLVRGAGGEEFAADMVVNGAGRVPHTAGLDLEKGGVAVDDHGITINQYLQSTSNPSVYVAGDANAGGRALSPVAMMEGRAAARNMIRGNYLAPDYRYVPGVLFTSPLLASVGMGAEEAERIGTTVVIHRKETPDWYSARRIGGMPAGHTILTERESGRILGAHLLGYNADEMINLFALAMRSGITLAELQEMVWAYPTAAFDISRIR